jgi:hypothetical protein
MNVMHHTEGEGDIELPVFKRKRARIDYLERDPIAQIGQTLSRKRHLIGIEVRRDYLGIEVLHEQAGECALAAANLETPRLRGKRHLL